MSALVIIQNDSGIVFFIVGIPPTKQHMFYTHEIMLFELMWLYNAIRYSKSLNWLCPESHLVIINAMGSNAMGSNMNSISIRWILTLKYTCFVSSSWIDAFLSPGLQDRFVLRICRNL